MKRKKLLASLLTLTLVVGQGSFATFISSAAVDDTTFSIAYTEGIIQLDPLDQSNATEATMNDMVFDSLYDSDHAGNYFPRLATGYDMSEDGLEWTIYLNEGVKFHNGEDCNADDVVCTFQRLIDNPTLNDAINYWEALESVEKIDDYTVKLTMSSPEIAAVTMGLASTAIIPDEAFEEYGTGLFTDQLMYGTGPWKFVEWVDGQYLHLEKNEDYWNGGNDSYYDEVYLRFVPEVSTAISAQVTDEVQGYFNVNGGIPQDLLGLYSGSEDKCELIEVVTSAIDYLGFQCGEDSPFNDVNVRRAFSMAIDRQSIIDGLLGAGNIMPGVLNSETLGYDEDLESEWYEYNPDAAKELLESTDYNGEEITISSVSSFNDLALAICEMVNAIGFNCNAEVVESATLADIRATGDYDAFIVTALHSSGDPYQFINSS